VDRLARLRDGLQSLVESGRLPSAAWSFVRETEVTAGGCGGAGPHTVFQVGSVTKAVTGLLLADQSERGVVLLTDPATRYLPGAVPGRVPLADLATHTAGLPRVPPGRFRYRLRPRNPYARYPRRQFLRAARRSLAGAAGGQPYQYSNFGAGLLGYLLGQAAATPYEDLVRDRICVPLGLRATTFDAVPVQGYAGGRPVPPWDMSVLAAAGGLHSTAADLAVLLTACLSPDRAPLGPAVRTALVPRVTIAPGQEISLGWHHTVRDGQRVIWHNGMTGGYTAMVAFRPERRIAAAALTNTALTNTALTSINLAGSPLDDLVLSVLFDN
jgi:D-alanyl-D-alanine-carboxypeptidase/D-alanyl-D-alanine-endopeptidase